MTRDKSTFAEGDERTEAVLPNQGVENTLTMLSERLGDVQGSGSPLAWGLLDVEYSHSVAALGARDVDDVAGPSIQERAAERRAVGDESLARSR